MIEVGKHEFVRLVLAQQIEFHRRFTALLHDIGQLARHRQADLHEFK